MVFHSSENTVYRTSGITVYRNTVHTGPRYTEIPSITGIPLYRYKPGNTCNTGISGFLPVEIVYTAGNPTPEPARNRVTANVDVACVGAAGIGQADYIRVT